MDPRASARVEGPIMHARSSVVSALAVLAFMLAACAAPTGPAAASSAPSAAPPPLASASPSPPNDAPPRIIALARVCADEHGARGVGGSPLQFDRATVSKSEASSGSSAWVVHLPEEQIRSLPTGLDIVVTTTGACSMAPMD
ncbi:Hypothetical protein A7982_07763 [Minicystis rosea]|nr:Hypothetical protein A7982_07763 [Minicystis rosea]